MKNIAIIPARAGSKGLPDKNIKLLNGKPLLQYSVEAALGSGCFDKVMVSTDSEKYAEIAREAGAEVPFLRSAYTSTDKASSWDMVEEVLDGYERLGWTFDTFCLLQPTSPMRTAEDIARAYGILREKNAFAVVSCWGRRIRWTVSSRRAGLPRGRHRILITGRTERSISPLYLSLCAIIFCTGQGRSLI